MKSKFLRFLPIDLLIISASYGFIMTLRESPWPALVGIVASAIHIAIAMGFFKDKGAEQASWRALILEACSWVLTFFVVQSENCQVSSQIVIVMVLRVFMLLVAAILWGSFIQSKKDVENAESETEK